MPLLLLISLAWLAISALLLAACRAAALDDRTRQPAVDCVGHPHEIPRHTVERPIGHQHAGGSHRVKQPRSARPHSRSLHASAR